MQPVFPSAGQGAGPGPAAQPARRPGRTAPAAGDPAQRAVRSAHDRRHPVACRQKNAAAFLKEQVPGVMAEYAPGLFSTEQRLHSRQPAPDDSEGVQDLVDWREDAPYG